MDTRDRPTEIGPHAHDAPTLRGHRDEVPAARLSCGCIVYDTGRIARCVDCKASSPSIDREHDMIRDFERLIGRLEDGARRLGDDELADGLPLLLAEVAPALRLLRGRAAEYLRDRHR